MVSQFLCKQSLISIVNLIHSSHRTNQYQFNPIIIMISFGDIWKKKLYMYKKVNTMYNLLYLILLFNSVTNLRKGSERGGRENKV